MTTPQIIHTRYTVSINVAKSASVIFELMVNNTAAYWPEQIEGRTNALGEEFIFRTGDAHYSKNRVIEFVPGKKFAWLVTDSIRKTDSFQWTGTNMIYELSEDIAGTKISFTYDGLVLENELKRLHEICDFCIKEKLSNFLK